MTLDASPLAIFNAYQAGGDAAAALKIGDRFTGAFGAFAETAFDARLRAIFTSGYLDNLRGPVYTTSDNIITKIGD